MSDDKSCILFTDGGSRGNPGDAGYGFVIFHDNSVIHEGYAFLGTVTNNQAEYHGLLAGLDAVVIKGYSSVTVKMDSELIVKHIKGEYKVRDEKLRPLYEEALGYIRKIEHFSIVHIPRAENKHADMLANKAMDTREPAEQPRGTLFAP